MAVIETGEMFSRVPLIVILGATGTGKSKLAIQLAKIYNGEIISADSMQVYRGLDIVTNKVTSEEMEGVPHHLLNFVDPLSNYTVVNFRDAALPIIDKLRSEGRPPVIVGGTHYYIESLLWKVLVAAKEEGNLIVKEPSQFPAEPIGLRARALRAAAELEIILNSQIEEIGSDPMKHLQKLLDYIKTESVAEASMRLYEEVGSMGEEQLSEVVPLLEKTEEVLLPQHPSLKERQNRILHARLKEVDPERADRLHHNDVRKIIRSLEIYEGKKERHSSLLEKQADVEGGSFLGGPLRYPDSTAVFWLQCNKEVLDKRLDDRVDDMISRGLVKQLEDFHEGYNRSRLSKNNCDEPYTQGIFQSIGLKEFHSYLILDSKDGDEALKALEEGITSLKLGTRRYARRQIKWIRGRFLRAPGRQVPPIYGLDTTDPSSWTESVLQPALSVLTRMMPGAVVASQPPVQPLPREVVTEIKELKGERLCKVCMRRFIGDLQWETHLISKKHRAMIKRKGKLETHSTKDLVPSEELKQNETVESLS